MRSTSSGFCQAKATRIRLHLSGCPPTEQTLKSCALVSRLLKALAGSIRISCAGPELTITSLARLAASSMSLGGRCYALPICARAAPPATVSLTRIRGREALGLDRKCAEYPSQKLSIFGLDLPTYPLGNDRGGI